MRLSHSGFQSTHPRGVRPAHSLYSHRPVSFQSTHPRGVRPRAAHIGWHRELVSIHAPAWGATGKSLTVSGATLCFNPRTRVGCDVGAVTSWLAGLLVSIHAPAWGATAQQSRRRQLPVRFQSTHPRGVRPRILPLAAVPFTVSIHAPAWGATIFSKNAQRAREVSIHAPAWGATSPSVTITSMVPVSIHAPAWGATSSALAMLQLFRVFQSTHPRGVRLYGIQRFRLRRSVSIHAPAWGATSRPDSPLCLGAGFNPRTRVGCDHAFPTAARARKSFNPRTRVGCDQPAGDIIELMNQFQSTHPRGVRPGIPFRPCVRGWFQSTHPRGVRPATPPNGQASRHVSIHAPAWGATNGI